MSYYLKLWCIVGLLQLAFGLSFVMARILAEDSNNPFVRIEEEASEKYTRLV
jgi:hypothetical protein